MSNKSDVDYLLSTLVELIDAKINLALGRHLQCEHGGCRPIDEYRDAENASREVAAIIREFAEKQGTE